MRFKKILLVLSLLFISTLPAKEVGDTISFYVNNFRLILSRDTVPDIGVVRYRGNNFYIVSADRVAIIKIGRFRIGNNYNRLWIGSKRLPGQNPAYIYNSSDGINWIWERGLSGMDLKIDRYIRPTGDTVTVADMDVFDFNYVRDSLPAIKAIIFAATSDGLFSTLFTSSPGPWKLEAFADTTVYGIAVNPMTISFGGRGQVLYAATSYGVYRVETQGFNSPSTDSLMGTLTDTVWTICGDPSDSSRLLIGAVSGIYRWSSNDWEHLNVNFGKVYNIRYIAGSFYVAADSGLFETSDYGNSWNTVGTFDYPVTDVVIDNGHMYVSLLGGGVMESPDNGNSWNDFSNGLETLRLLGSKNVYTIFNDSTGLYLGCDEGVYHYNETLAKWENVSNGVGSLMTDRTVSTVASVLENDSVSVFDSIISYLHIDPNVLVDVDNDPRVYIILTRLVQTSNATDPTVIPVFGYFDPRDEDLFDNYSTKREVLVVDLSKFISNGSINRSKLQAFMGYLYGRYAVWSVDMQANPAELTGVAAWATYRCGFDFADGVKGGIDYLGNKKYLNSPLLDYTHQWLNSPVAREIDRERMLLWFEYMAQIYGDTVVTKDVLHGGLRGYRSLNEVIKKYSYGKDSLLTFAPKWYLALTFNRTLYLQDSSGSIVDTAFGYAPPMDSIHVKSAAISDIPGSGEQKSSQVMAPSGFAVWRDAIDTITGERFNAKDGDQDYLKIFMVCGTDSVAKVVPLDSLGRFAMTVNDDSCSSFKYLIANLNVSKTIPYYLTEDTTAPQIVGTYALQNPGNPRMIQMYVVGYDKVGSRFYGLMTDVKTPNPIVTFSTLVDSTPEARVYNMKLLSSGDSLFNYFVPVLLDLRGDIEVSVRAQDLAGNDASIPPDTISVQSISEQGGVYTALGGQVIIEAPANAFPGATTILIDKIDKDLAELTYHGASTGMSDVYLIGNNRITSAREITIKIRPTSREAQRVYAYRNGEWEPIKTYYDEESGFYIFRTRKLGAFQLRSGTPERFGFSFAVVNGPIIYSNKNIRLNLSLDRADKVDISLYNTAGRMVKRLVSGKLQAGIHTFDVNTSDIHLTSGVYFIRLKTSMRNVVKKIVFLKY